MSTVDQKALEELKEYEVDDNVLVNLLNIVMKILEKSKLTVGLNGELFVINNEKASKNFQTSRYATSNCKALLSDGFIVASERFLIEIECAIRSFEAAGSLNSSSYLRSDADLFSLVYKIRDDPYKYVRRIRRITELNSQKERLIQETVALTFLFFIAHEMGHIFTNTDARNFTEFVNSNSPLENRLANAVVKLRRHAEQFLDLEFGLPGFKHILDEGDKVQKSIAMLQKEIEILELNHSKWFKDEMSADQFATKVMIEHLSEQGSDESSNAIMYQMIRGMFGAALYSWYVDLQAFSLALGINWPPSSVALAVTMLENREQYIKAASLFGNIHQFTLLRAQQLMFSVIKARNNKSDDREAMARYYLTCMLMDTAVKIAFVGACTAYFKQRERLGGPKLFVIEFESINVALKRVNNLLNKGNPWE